MSRPGRAAISRRELLLSGAGALLLGACSRRSPDAGQPPASGTLQTAARDSMRRATQFMRDQCAYRGGYVWSYAADFSRRWGEMEAYPTMIWIQPPGTATVGHLFIDCLHATRDDYYYESAADVAEGLIAAQHPSGGWNYLHDFAGESSIRRWYDTIGRNGWRLEEFHHYYGNATFDDAGTSEASQFLLRLYLEKREDRYREPLEKALQFVLKSQYPNGGWPQRYPFVDDTPSLHGHPDYTRHITFNDDVAGENIKFLLMIWQASGDERALNSVVRAMDVFPATQQPAPQAGWGLQHDAKTLRPTGARSYEPMALATHTTASNISLMLDFYQWTADPRFLERLPEAIAWLESVRLAPDQLHMQGREFPTFIEIGTNRPIYNHRRGSNVVNGAYLHDHSPENPIRHYSQWRSIDLDGLIHRLGELKKMPADELREASPLRRRGQFELPRFFTARSLEVSDLNSNVGTGNVEQPGDELVRQLVGSLNNDGYWPTPLTATSNPYIGNGPETVAVGDFTQTLVGDASDTSPHLADSPATGISTGRYIQNMTQLLLAVAD